MKAFVAIAVLTFVSSTLALTPEQIARALELAKECITESGAPVAIIEKMRKGDFSDADEKTQCFAKCVLERAGFFKEGVLDEKTVIEKLSTNVPKEQVQKTFDACKNEKGANHCETAFKIAKCYAENKIILA